MQRTQPTARTSKARTRPAKSSPETTLWPAIGPRLHWVVVIGLGVLVLLAFSNTLHNTGFALDNKFIILEDPRLRQSTQDNLKLIFTEDYWWPKAVSGLYRPLTTLSYMFNCAVLGNDGHAAGYHWINLLLHWLNAILVYFTALVLLKNLWPAAFTAALFATHPIVTESVSNIIGRADLFATAAIVGGLLCYAKSTTVGGWRKASWLVALMVVTTIGVFCKESAVAVLGVMALYDFTYRMQRKRPGWLANLVANFWGFAVEGYLALIPPFALLWYVRHSVFEKLRPPELPFVDNPLVGWDFWTARMTAVKVIGKYFWLLLWPRTLSCDYSYNQIPMVDWHFHTWEDLKALIALISVVMVVLVAIRNYRRNQALFFFILLFFGTFLPTSNLMVIIGSIMAERFMYLPSIGFAGCLVIAVHALYQRTIPRLKMAGPAGVISPPAVAGTVLGIVVLACGVRTYYRNFDWEDDVRLWTQAVQVYPDSFKTHKSLAFALYERDMQKNLGDFPDIDRIIEEAEKARDVMDAKPLPALYRASIVYLHLGAYYRLKGDILARHSPDSGRPWYQKSIEVLNTATLSDHAFNEDNRQKELARGRAADQIPDVGNQQIYLNLGLSYMRLGQYPDALNAYLGLRHLAPTDPDAYINIASAYLASGHAAEAAVSLIQALLLDDSRKEALQALTDIYRRTGHESCALIMTSGPARLNNDCPIVHDHLCAACSDLAHVFIETKQFDLAERIKKSGLQKYHCPPELFEQSTQHN